MLALVACLLAAGCSADERLQGVDTLPHQPPVAKPMVSSLTAPTGSRIAIAIVARGPRGEALSGVQGELRFDPARLRYAGQPPLDSIAFPFVVVNDARAGGGALRVASVNPRGLDSASAVLAFDVLASDYGTSVTYRVEAGLTVSLEPIPADSRAVGPGVDPALKAPDSAIRVGAAEWKRLLGPPGLRPRPNLIDSVPAGRRYGDIYAPAGVDVVDAYLASNWAVGNSPNGMAAPGPGDLMELAGNVWPDNSPGLGEATDTKGPGWDANCVRWWEVNDASFIANEAVGNDRPVAGELVPADAVDPATKLPRRGSGCTPSGAAPPPIPALGYPQDSLYLVQSPLDTTFIYYRRLADVHFVSSVTGPTVYALLTKYRATIVGGTPFTQGYIIQMPDPDPSFSAFMARLDSIRAEPSVRYVVSITARDAPPIVHSRYPADGAAHRRGDWFTAAASTWASRAIRAPLSWGCETGEWAPIRPPIGVLEWNFKSPTGELSGSLSAEVYRPTGLPNGLADPAALQDELEWHGTAVAATLAASADDSIGVAGQIWSSDLRLYALGSLEGGTSAARRTNALALVEQILPQIAADGRRIVNMSIELGGDPNDPHSVDYLVDGFVRFMNLAPNALLIKTLGNDSLRLTAGSLFANIRYRRLLAALSKIRDSLPSLGTRMLFVAATRDPQPGQGVGNVLWGKSNTLDGQTDIAAPGDAIDLLASPTAGTYHGNGEIVSKSGTSFAAPLAAGVAAQLLALDPSLSPAEVKDYIVRGASQPRLNPATGSYQAPLPVSGAQVPVYQLDAYGALTLLSAERPNTPICGYEVTVEPVTSPPLGFIVRLEPPGRPPVAYTVAGSPYIRRLSVAQGGRRIAVSGGASGAGVVLDHLGGVLHAIPLGTERQYLERDTADIVNTGEGSRTITLTGLHRGLADANLQPLNGIAYGSPFLVEAISVSPTGENVAFYVRGFLGSGACGYSDARMYVAPLHGGSPTVAWSSVGTPCGYPQPGPGEVAWSQSGIRAVLSTSLSLSGLGARTAVLAEWDQQRGIDSSTIGPVLPSSPRYASDENTVQLYEFNSQGQCMETLRDRRTGSFGALVGNPISVAGNLCAYASTVQPNLNGSVRAASGSAQTGAPMPQPRSTKLRVRAN